MGKGKLAKFADMARYENVFQYPYSVVEHVPFAMQGNWNRQYFRKQAPIVLELGCGKGEYTVELARQYPDKNFVGVDIKGARMWTGATMALNEGLDNVAFLRTNIEIIDRFFSGGEVSEIWLTFSDPQMKNPRKRLTSTFFMERYRRILTDGGTLHLKTDSNFLYTYTCLMVGKNQLPLLYKTDNLYRDGQDTTEQLEPGLLSIQTYYEKMWLERGINIKYVKWQLPSTGSLEEPDVEIEMDDYRSYRRDKRSPLQTAR
jgi:tRNA (guanine-N7-)-methyltransferase